MVFAHWIHDLSPFAIEFSEGLGIRWYGLAYVAGFVVAWLLLRDCHRRGWSPIDAAGITDLMTALILGVFVGGRIGYFVLYSPESLFRDPVALIRVWEGGMASHGGFAGVVAALAWFGRRRAPGFLGTADLVATAVAPGLFFGRIANFINGELWGKVSEVPWAVVFPASGPPGVSLEAIPARHPSQLYEAALEGLALGIWMQWRLRRCPELLQNRGRLSGEFLLGYAFLRSIGEAFREPDAGLIFGLNRGIFYSVFLAAGGIYLIWRSGKRGVRT